MNTSQCRVCGGELQPFLDLGPQPLSNHFAPSADPDGYRFRLEVGGCAECTMVQLIHEVPRELMFREDYPYLSSGSVHMGEHFRAAAQWGLAHELTGNDPFAVELGCNDGVFLKHIAAAGVRHLGVEPSAEVAQRAAEHGIDVRVDFFDEDLAREIRAKSGPADLIFAANTLCHIPYISSVLDGVEALLADSGVFVFEDPYLGDILRSTSFDQIYDEHFFYFSAHSVRAMARRSGLELVDVVPLTVHGGELRYTLARAGARAPSEAVAHVIEAEERDGVTDPGRLAEFAGAVRAVADDLVSFLRAARDRGDRVVGFGATAKSATVLNYCGIGPDLISVIYDSSPTKQGRVTPGTHIPVVPSDRFGEDDARFVVLFAWNHAQEIMARESALAETGRRWVLYVPTVQLV